ncbi:MAG: hypothetical protein OXN84_05905, partial [Albidovulum sp.]|nr:hypothetical protein [Albidovulum sp.]
MRAAPRFEQVSSFIIGRPTADFIADNWPVRSFPGYNTRPARDDRGGTEIPLAKARVGLARLRVAQRLGVR